MRATPAATAPRITNSGAASAAPALLTASTWSGAKAASMASRVDVDRVLVATTNEHFKATVKDLPFTRDTLAKIEHVNRNPFRLQRRNLDHALVDYMFADLWPDAWNLDRIEELRTFAREFRPRRMGYRWQELDVAANWVAKGYVMPIGVFLTSLLIP